MKSNKWKHDNYEHYYFIYIWILFLTSKKYNMNIIYFLKYRIQEISFLFSSKYIYVKIRNTNIIIYVKEYFSYFRYLENNKKDLIIVHDGL